MPRYWEFPNEEVNREKSVGPVVRLDNPAGCGVHMRRAPSIDNLVWQQLMDLDGAARLLPCHLLSCFVVSIVMLAFAKSYREHGPIVQNMCQGFRNVAV